MSTAAISQPDAAFETLFFFVIANHLPCTCALVKNFRGGDTSFYPSFRPVQEEPAGLVLDRGTLLLHDGGDDLPSPAQRKGQVIGSGEEAAFHIRPRLLVESPVLPL